MAASGPGGREGTYAKGVQRRREILERALEVFAVRGVEGTSLRAIGEAIGVSHAALTHYFPSREALLLEVLRTRAATTSTSWEDEDSLAAALAGVAEANARVPGVIALHTSLLAAAVESGNTLARDFFLEHFARGRRGLQERLRREQAVGRVAPDLDLGAVASLIMAASDGLQIQWLLDRRVDVPAALALVERLLRSAPVPGTAPS